MNKIRFWMFFGLLGFLAAPATHALDLNCPDSGDDVHHREAVATSAPEVKVSANAQEDEARWSKIVRPLSQKAIKLAKAQRAALMQEGIEKQCSTPQIYVGRLVPSESPSGCDHRIITRTGENGALFVQVIATCKYDWSCCTPQEGKSSKGGGFSSFSLEGPLSSGTTSPAAPGKSPAPKK